MNTRRTGIPAKPARIISILRTSAFVSCKTHPNNKYGLGLKYRGRANYTNKTCSRNKNNREKKEARNM